MILLDPAFHHALCGMVGGFRTASSMGQEIQANQGVVRGSYGARKVVGVVRKRARLEE